MNEETFGSYIRKIRLSKEISLRAMAQKIDVTPSYLSDIEKDRRNAPNKNKIDALAQHLEVGLEDRARLFDLAGRSKKTVAPDLEEDVNQRESIRILLRKASTSQDDQIKKIIDLLDKGDV